VDKILQKLNPEQREAVTASSRYTQIVAGPGTGKTTTLAAKMLYEQTENEVDTDKILGISFSRSAKTQLLKKLDEFTDNIGYGGKPVILTFHSLAYRIIRNGIRYNESKFRDNFSRISTEEFLKLDPSLIKDLCKDYADRELVNRALSQAYNLIRQGSKLEEFPAVHWSEIPQATKYNIKTYDYGRVIISSEDLVTFWQRINKIEKIRNVTDYQGLISEAIRLLSLKKHTYNYVTDSYSHYFIDEYQDTSLAQEKLLFLLNKNQFITVVGDPNQTIYTFNGSNSKNMQRFLNHYKRSASEQTEEIRLIKNYRSTNEIVITANNFMAGSDISAATNTFGEQPVGVETSSIKLAAEFIATKIIDLIQQGKYKYEDICVLYRKNSEFSPQASLVSEAFTEYNIPFNNDKNNKEKTETLFSQILQIREEYEDELLEDVLEKLGQKNTSDDVINFVIEAIDQGAADTDDMADLMTDYEMEEAAEGGNESVSVKSVHESKGQEFPVVFILFLGDREFPHSSDPDIDEEERLLYVALTRAQEELFIVGQKGIAQPGFLDKCLTSDIVRHIKFFSSGEEEKNDGFSAEDKKIIDKTIQQQIEEEKRQQEELRKLMDLF
jgi:DNA helicase-2/ATP-dependent DNA helicase PcrA